MKKKAIAMLVVATLVATSMVSFTGCKKDDPVQNTVKKVEQFKGTKVYKGTLGKIATINPHTSTLGSESDVRNCMSAYFVDWLLDEKNEAKEYPLMAKEAAQVSEDGAVYTYKLREGLKFSDGTPIDAETYIYSYQKLIDPNMKNLRATALFSNLEIKGARNYFQGKGKWEDVGIKAKDKYTLEFTLSQKEPLVKGKAFTNGLAAYLVNPVVYERCMAPDKKTTTYGSTFDSVKDVSYGPYKIVEWKMDQFYKFEKNKDFPMAEKYSADFYEYRVVEDGSARMQLFENKDLDRVDVDASNYDKYKEDPRIRECAYPYISLLNVNSKSKTNPVLQDLNMRKALFYGLDREKLAKDVAKTALPAPYFISNYFYQEKDGKTFVYREQEGSKKIVPKNNGYDKTLAKELFDKAYEANGNKKIVITEMYSDGGQEGKNEAEFRKAAYEGIFGSDKFEYKLVSCPVQVWRDKLLKLDYDIAAMNWSAGTAYDPITRLSPHRTKENTMKADTFNNDEFDELYNKCIKGDLRFDEKAKLEAAQKLEKLLIDDCSVIPTYEDISVRMYSDKLNLPLDKYNVHVGYGADQAIYTRE